MLEFIDANDIVVAKSTEEVSELKPAEEREVKFSTITHCAKLHLVNCYSGDDAVATVSYTVVYKDGKSIEGTTDYSAEGKYDIDIESTAPISVASVVLKDKKGNAFEWFDYSTPVTGSDITMDATTDNEFANGAYVDDNTECLVANPRQLNNVRKHLGGKFRQIKDIDFGKSFGVNVIVKDEAYCTETINDKAPFFHVYDDGCAEVCAWVPIGSKPSDNWEDIDPFTGSYNGDNFKISNLICDRWREGDRRSRTGLFGTVDGATLENICMDDTCVIISGFTTGSIVGMPQNFGDAKKTVVNGCTSAAKLYVTNNSGGIVGSTRGACELEVTNCEFSGIIETQRLSEWDVAHEIESSGNGGIVGNADNGSTIAITGCTFSGKMINSTEVKSCSSKFIYKAGGILGLGMANATVTIKDCTNAGTMEFMTWMCGGAVGNFVGSALTLDNCQVTGTMTLSTSAYHQNDIGGLVGNTSVVPVFANGSNCKVNIGVEGTADYIGGIIGYADATESELMAALTGNVGIPGFAGGDVSKNRGKYCGFPFVDALISGVDNGVSKPVGGIVGNGNVGGLVGNGNVGGLVGY